MKSFSNEPQTEEGIAVAGWADSPEQEVWQQIESVNGMLASLNNEHGLKSLRESRLDEAISCFLCSLAFVPGKAEAHNNLGIAFFRQGSMKEARVHFQRAILFDRSCYQAFHNLGNLCRAQGEVEEAMVAYEMALTIAPHYFEAANNLAICLLSRGELSRAIQYFQRTLALKPDHADAANNLGISFLRLNNIEAAISAFRLALQVNPGCYQAENNLGVALESFESPSHYEQSLECYRRAIALCPGYADAHNNMGNVLYWIGQREEAHRYYMAAIKLAPRRIDFYRNFSESWTFSPEDPHLLSLREIEKEMGELSAEDQLHLHFTLAKAFQDLREEETAFQYLLRGNALKRKQTIYPEENTLKWLASIREVFTKELIAAKQGQGHPSSEPVFVVGMMRSGTSLIEQILASHPLVFGAGERKEFERGLLMREGEKSPLQKFKMPPELAQVFPAEVGAFVGADLRDLGSRYLAGVRSLPSRSGVQRIVDKMPLNFRFIGLIHLVFPNARIIHARRDPVDTCLSSFSKLFVEDHPYTYDLGELGRYYHAYDRLMEHWKKVLPENVMLEVNYEDMVANFDHEARRMVDHLGLAWSENCRNFHQTVRPVRTASTNQVRQPLYRTSIGRWRPDEIFLTPLLDGLAHG